MTIDSFDSLHSLHAAWSPLKKGDKLYVIAPASCNITGDELDAVRVFFEEAFPDLTLVFPDGMIQPFMHMSNVLEKRVEYIMRALCDPDVKAMWCLAGGEGTVEATDFLERHHFDCLNMGQRGLEKRGIPLIGFSDTVALNIFLGKTGVVSPINGPNLLSFSHPRPFKDNAILQKEIQSVKDIIYGRIPHLTYDELVPLNHAATQNTTVSGHVVGGYTALVQASIGTFWQLETERTILVLEGCDRPFEPHTVREVLDHLDAAGLLRSIVALIFGGMKIEEGRDITEVHHELRCFAEVMDKRNIPVLMGMPVGHTDINMPLPLYTPSLLELGESPSLSVALYRTEENSLLAYEHFCKRMVWSVVGGNIYAIQRAIGTEDQLCAKDKVLFFDDCASPSPWQPEKLHTVLRQMLLAGLFEGAKGVIVGEIKVTSPEQHAHVARVLNYFAGRCNMPFVQIAYQSERKDMLAMLSEDCSQVKIKANLLEFPLMAEPAKKD